MRIFVPTSPVTTPVSKDTFAPWLKRRSSKVKVVYDWEVWVGDDRIVVPAGYISDWSTIPRFAWFIYPPNLSEARQAALVHDYIYSHLWPLYSRKFADDLLRRMMLKDGARKSTAAIFYYSVRVGRGGGWYKVNKRNAHPFWRAQQNLLAKSM